MGTWGEGNFENDTAADYLSTLTHRLIAEIEAAMAGDPNELQPDEYWGVAVPCALELLQLIKAQGWVGAMLPAPDKVASWRQTFLAIWEQAIPGLGARPEHVRARRAILARTFDRLATPEKKPATSRAKASRAPAAAPAAAKAKRRPASRRRRSSLP